MWKTTARVSAIGLEMAVAIVIGYLIGRWLDRRFDCKPWLTLVFLLVGVAAGFRGLIRVAQVERARQRRQQTPQQRQSSPAGDAGASKEQEQTDG